MPHRHDLAIPEAHCAEASRAHATAGLPRVGHPPGPRISEISGDDPPSPLAELVLRRSALTQSEVVLLHSVFPAIMSTHLPDVWSRLRKRRVERAQAQDIAQEVFVTLFHDLVAEGFPNGLSGKIMEITDFKLLCHARDRNREQARLSIGVPSSGSEPVPSPPDVARAVDYRALGALVLAALPEAQRAVFEMVVLKGVPEPDVARVLDIKPGTLKSRLMLAKKKAFELLEPILPSSQRP